MSDQNRRLDKVVEDFQRGRLSRRGFVRKLTAAGLTMPAIAGILAACGSDDKPSSGASSTQAAGGGSPAAAQATSVPSNETNNPTKRGGGGTLKLLWWQAPTLANAHLSGGTKDLDASRLFTEPLAAIAPDGSLFPILAAEVPSIEKGTVAKDGKSVTWKLKKDVTWHDGKPLTADDVVFTYEYVMDKETAAVSAGTYAGVASVEKVDDLTVKVNFKDVTPAWADLFTSSYGHIFPKHVLSQFKGKEARNAPFNLKPIGTGPYKMVEFRPGDTLVAEINANYHVANRPFFDRVEMKGGGDATSAARSVLQTGEYDFAWNIQAIDDVLKKMEKEGGVGRVVYSPGSSTEHIQLNYTDPNVEVDGEKSSLKTKHPFFSDIKVRQAVSLAIDRETIKKELYGAGGEPGNVHIFNPKQYIPTNVKSVYDLKKAEQLLDEAGWKKGSDGVRAKDGKQMKVLYQTSVNDVRQLTQQIIKKDLEKIGFKVELKEVDSGVFFGSDPNNPDNYPHFYADMQMYSTSPSSPDPQTWMRQWLSTDVAQKANGWSGQNRVRYQNPEMDKIWAQAAVEVDPAKRTELIKKMNEIAAVEYVYIPVINRGGVSVAKNNIKGFDISPFDSNLWKLAYWFRQ
jgi:peptide/nickel transport system substrate-binding protein